MEREIAPARNPQRMCQPMRLDRMKSLEIKHRLDHSGASWIDPSIPEAFRADIAAVVDRDPACTRVIDLSFKIIDTAGLEEGDSASLPGRMRAQTETALDLADAIFFVFDSRTGLTPADRFFASLVRRAGKPLILIANKAEGRVGAAGALEGYDLGLGVPVPLSAEHGDGLADLYVAVREALPEATALPAEMEEDAARLRPGDDEDGSELDITKPLRIAIIGRPNAGKSTLLNRIIGQDRSCCHLEPRWRGIAARPARDCRSSA